MGIRLYVAPVTLGDSVGSLNQHDSLEQDLKDKIHKRLNARCEYDNLTGCWVYTGCWDKCGQGCIRVGHAKYTLPRVSAWLYIPGFHLEDARVAYRTCDQGGCFNPDHVRIAANQADALARLRALGRFGQGRRKLNQATAQRLRAQYGLVPEGPGRKEFVRRESASLGTRSQAVRNIVDGYSWVRRAA